MPSSATVVAASSYPLLNAFWTMLIFFLWIVWIFILIRTIIDIFRSEDLSGVAKALWLLFVIVLPYLGVFIYLIARGDGIYRRETAAAATMRTGNVADDLSRLAALKDQGVLTQDEFDAQKAKLLA